LAARLSQIDELTIANGDHYYLTAEDRCFFLGEYSPGAGYEFSKTNQRILNFKKSVARRTNANEWYWKEREIQAIANDFRSVLGNDQNRNSLMAATLVPIPPSKCKTDPLYDDRLLKVLQQIAAGMTLDIRELLIQTVSTLGAHEGGVRPRPQEIAEIYAMDDRLANPPPTSIWLFDDLLTTGCHFKAAQQVLRQVFPDARIAGLFVARRVLPASGMEAG
jgi:hypothetical protein